MCIRDRDWPIYKDVTELTEAANVILLGKVTDISFQVLDDRTARPPSEETEEWNRSLNTISVSYTHLDVYKRQGLAFAN